MRYIFLILVNGLVFLGFFICLKDHAKTSNRAPAATFKGTILRDVSENELLSGVKVLDCSGSFVRNRHGRVLIMTARHCLRLIDSCIDIKIAAQTSIDGKVENLRGSCRSLEIDDEEHDIVLFDATIFDSKGLAYKPPLEFAHCLTDRPTPIGTSIRIFHFPQIPSSGVQENSARISVKVMTDILLLPAKVSEQCEITSDPVYCGKCKDKQTVQWHNCSVFAGSSGSGAIDLYGCIVGVSHAADPSNKEYPRESQAANSGVVSLFVEKHRKKLESLGVQIGATESTGAPPATNLKIEAVQ